MGEADPARILADPHQVVAFGRGEILEPVVTAARRRQQAQVPRALERRHQQEAPGRGRQPGDPRDEQLLQALAERQHRRQRLRRRALRNRSAPAASSSRASGLPCATPSTRLRTRGSRPGNRAATSSVAA